MKYGIRDWMGFLTDIETNEVVAVVGHDDKKQRRISNLIKLRDKAKRKRIRKKINKKINKLLGR